MAVFRIEKTRDYTVMSNHHLKDRTLTLKSKGLLHTGKTIVKQFFMHIPVVSSR